MSKTTWISDFADALPEWLWATRAGRRRKALRYLNRSLAHLDKTPEQPTSMITRAMQAPEDCLASVWTTAAGLTTQEAASRLQGFGPNEVAHEEHAGWPRQLLRAFNNPFNILLIVLAGISYATHDLKATTILSVMVGLSSMLRFVQEYRSNRAAERLQAMVSTKVSVRRIHQEHLRAEEYAEKVGIAMHARSGGFSEIPLRELVLGDIVRLSAGDMIPADLRLLSAKDLFISQAALTGESFPVEKTADVPAAVPASPLDLPNVCFMGSNVVSGTATAVVIATARRTYLGQFSKLIVGHREPTEFDKGIHRVSWLLIRFMLVMVPLVFVINGVARSDWTEAFLFAIAVAVGLTPEMLPMIVTGTLAKGAVAMSRRKVIVKRLNAIQNFGAMDVLCTDKTGTLTRDKVALEKHVDAFGNASDDVIKHAYLNSYYQTGLKNLLDAAVLSHVEVAHANQIPGVYRLVDEIPFDFVRRRMTVVVNESGDHNELICKGAVEEMLAICTSVRLMGQNLPISEEIRQRIDELRRSYNEDGLRVIAVAYRETPGSQKTYGVQDESELTLLGFIAFLDPPKDSAEPALKALRDHGVRVKILTGDNETVTRKVCRDVGLDTEQIVLGSEIDALGDHELAALADASSVFAKLSPAQKERIVRALQSRGHVVGFLGDGINDSPALRTADIGISVDSAVDIAKESADLILLEKSLTVLEEGVIEGRKTFGNITKYIKMAASSNFGNMFSVVGASIFLPFLPMLPLQILIQNLLYDISQTAIPFDDVDREYTDRPRKWEIGSLARFMLFIGPISSIFDYATFGLMWWWFGAQTQAEQGLFQSGWFVEGLLSQTLIVHIIRTQKIPFLQSRAAWPLLVMTALVMAIGLYIPFSPIAGAAGLKALPAEYFGWLLAMLAAYALLTQSVKVWFVRKYGFS
ncbi:MAG: magnesium-translocating P-type ATPase [Nevskiaceae bacterium]|nr:MAG: magnesium-translocating P-type ATPase [Nevskiaceae bacterium]